MLVTQFAPRSDALSIVAPPESQHGATLQFPTPAWGKRRCVAVGSGAVYGAPASDELPDSECSGHGTCELARLEGGREVYECACGSGWFGDNCGIGQQVTNVSVALLFPSVGDPRAALQRAAARLAIERVNAVPPDREPQATISVPSESRTFQRVRQA